MKTLKPKDIIEIPQISNYDMFEKNRDNAYSRNLNHCPCCGRAIQSPKFFFNSIWGANAYPANDKIEYADAWVMGVGPECQKKFPKGYIFTI
jgi:hypothetical protein